jgi:DNA-binding MarR family transcriptional regulator
MNDELKLTVAEKLNKAVSILDRKKQVEQDYGISFPLNHAKIYLLYTIHRYPDENISQLALRLGITKGAIAQITKKLLEKGLMTSFHTSENKKDEGVKK